MKLLAPSASARLTDAFLSGDEPIDVADLVTDEGREVDVSGIVDLVSAATERFQEASDADAWLAVRLHALFRLSRREASLREFWMHLAFVDCPHYVRWRFPGQAARFSAEDMNHAFSRLWWGAELFRAGSSYAPVARAFSPQDVPNTIFRLRAAHSRVFCAALVRFVSDRRTDGKPLTGRQVNRLSTAINSQLFVAALDAAAPDPPTDGAAQRHWRAESVTVDQLVAGDPDGPDDLTDGAAFAARTDTALSLLHRFADGAGIATVDDPRAGSKRPGDVDDSEAPAEAAGWTGAPP